MGSAPEPGRRRIFMESCENWREEQQKLRGLWQSCLLKDQSSKMFPWTLSWRGCVQAGGLKHPSPMFGTALATQKPQISPNHPQNHRGNPLTPQQWGLEPPVPGTVCDHPENPPRHQELSVDIFCSIIFILYYIYYLYLYYFYIYLYII